MTEQTKDEMKVRVEITMPQVLSDSDFQRLIKLFKELHEFTVNDTLTLQFEISFTRSFNI